MVTFNRRVFCGGGGGGGWRYMTEEDWTYFNAFRRLCESTKDKMTKLKKDENRLDALEAMIERNMAVGEKRLVRKYLKMMRAGVPKKRWAKFKNLKWNLITNGNTRLANLDDKLLNNLKQQRKTRHFQRDLRIICDEIKVRFGVDPQIEF